MSPLTTPTRQQAASRSAASKQLSGRALAAGEFSFQLKEGATVLQTKTNAADGSITFDAINYSVADKGLHTYTITEMPSALGGVTIDPMVLTVTVDVVDNGDGTLTATPTYPADVTFNNTYAATGSVSLSASKQLSGRALAAGEFSFQLKEGATLIETKSNAADGSIDFAAINYTLADKGATYLYNY
ncbi:MAG: Spy0128 family protein [Saccharofermentanales bacterium]